MVVRLRLGRRSLTRVLRGLRVKLPRRLGGYFHNDADHRDFVAIGTAAGKKVDQRTPYSRHPRAGIPRLIRSQNVSLELSLGPDVACPGCVL